MGYDFTDQQVLGLVQMTHTPIEVGTDTRALGDDLSPIELSLVCNADRHPWPCPAVVELRDFLKDPAAETRARGSGENGAITAADRVSQLIADGRLNLS